LAVDCLDIVADASKSLRSWWNQEDIEGSDMLIRRLDGKRLLEGRTRSRLAGTRECERCVFTEFCRCEHIDMMNTKTRANPVFLQIYLEFEV